MRKTGKYNNKNKERKNSIQNVIASEMFKKIMRLIASNWCWNDATNLIERHFLFCYIE